MKSKSNKKAIICSIGLVALIACQTETKKEDVSTSSPVKAIDSSKTPVNSTADIKLLMVIANVSSPFETIRNLTNTEVDFKKELLNNTDNAAKYVTTAKKALNFGVYGVDAAYVATNKGDIQATKYFVTARNLAMSLDAVETLDNVAGSRLEGHWDNKDTVAKVLNGVYSATFEYLKTNERQLAAAQILTGLWVESQYITMDWLKGQNKNGKSEFLFKKLFEQKTDLDHIASLLKEYEKEKDFKPIIDKIQELNKDFQEISSVDEIPGEKLEELYFKIKAIRELIIS